MEETSTHISALLDIVFKYLLGARESTPLLTDFINAVEKDSGFPEIENVTIENPFNDKTYLDDKLSIIDVRACCKRPHYFITATRNIFHESKWILAASPELV